jgi:hypothetical protein
LSSAILYLAIVGIWALVLVPRWLRPSRASGTLESNLAEPMAASPPEVLAAAADDGDGEEEDGDDIPGGQSAAPPSPTERRGRVLQARRRMLATLIVLTAGAAAIAAVHLAASWVVIPPALMLAGFVLLLREAARSDTERARAAASPSREASTGARTGPGTQQQPSGPADPDRAGAPSAKIIDISARVGDQLYDQYADAEVRAVGD